MNSKFRTLASVIALSLSALSASAGLSPASAQGVLWGGFVGQYQPGLSGVTAPSFQRRDARIDFSWTAVGPGGSLSPEFRTAGWSTFSGSWTGQVMPSTTETYTLTVKTADGVALYYRPTGTTSWTPLYTNYSTGSKTGQKSVALVAGTSYDIAVHYWQHAASGRLQLGWSSPTIAYQVIEAATPVGINGSPALPGEPGNMFADIVKQGRAYTSYSSTTTAAALDTNGAPLADATLPLWSSGRELDGVYQVSFTGQAKVTDWATLGSFSVGGVSYGTVLPAGVGYDATSNTTSFLWTVAAASTPTAASLGFGQTLRTAASATGSGITNLSIMRPVAPGSTTTHAPGELFSAQYKSYLSYFTGVRFMDYMATNGNKQAHWSDRVTPAAPSQYQPVSGYGWQGKGASLEYLVALANETGKDAWINVPLYVDDDYVTKLAQLLAYGSDGTTPYTSPQANPAYPPLNSNLKVYLEYSNELWNTAYQQNAGNLALAQAEVAAGGSPLNYDGSTDSAVWAKRRVVNRTVQISNLFRTTWGDGGMMTRVRPVFEWQYANSNNTAAIGLTFLENYYGNADGKSHVATPHQANYYLWGGGGGWYVSVKNSGASTIGAMYASGETTPSTEGDAIWAYGFGLHEMGYEGGFEVGGDNPYSLQLAANLDPGAQAAETTAIDKFFQLGGGTPFVFNAAGSSAYGVASPTINDQATPKMQAVLQAISTQRPASAFAWPLPIDAGNIPVSFSMGVTPSGTATGTLANIGDYVSWTVSVTQPCNFTITTDAATPSAVQILVDDTVVGTGSWTGPLTVGLHGIRARNLSSSGATLTKAIVTKAP
ncbi:MAG: Fibronectin type domain protein [Rhodospirillales bacterium]|nr:Fibronectin type domain protein [Rhodospirillales bacterium]